MIFRDSATVETARGALDDLIDIYNHSAPDAAPPPADKRALARQAVSLWWQIYETLVYWAQCELVGSAVLAERTALIRTWTERNGETVDDLSEIIGHLAASTMRPTQRRRKELERIMGPEQFDLVWYLARAARKAPPDVQGLLGAQALAPNMLLDQSIGRNGPTCDAQAADDALAAEDVQRGTAGHGKDTGPATQPLRGTKSPEGWKMKALIHVRLSTGAGTRLSTALAVVARATGCALEDLVAWEREAAASEALANTLFCAELAGEFMPYLRAAHYSRIPDYQRYGSHDGLYNIARAARIARDHRFNVLGAHRINPTTRAAHRALAGRTSHA